MPVSLNGSGPISGATTLNGLTIPTTGFGKVLQIARGTDTTRRTSTSTSYTDVTGVSVTVTPLSSTSTFLVIFTGFLGVGAGAGAQAYGFVQLTNGSNVALSGAENTNYGTDAVAGSVYFPVTLIGYSAPATTSPVTYKLRYRIDSGTKTVYAYNDLTTANIYAIEVAA